MGLKLMGCPYSKVTIKHGNEPDLFGVFTSTFRWCEEHSTQDFRVHFIDDKTVEVTFVSTNGCSYLINVLTEYISKHTFVKAIDRIVNATGVDVEEQHKELTYTMCVNIVNNFLSSAQILLNWSLHRYFQNNEVLNIALYEKLNMRSLREDFENMLNKPYALNYIFDSLERIISAESSNERDFLRAGLLTKSIVENRPVFGFKNNEPLCVWLDNGKITFGCSTHRFGIKDVVCKELYEQGFNPQKDMTPLKIVALAVLFVCPERICLYQGLHNKGVADFMQNNVGVFGEVEVVNVNQNAPSFNVRGDDHE